MRKKVDQDHTESIVESGRSSRCILSSVLLTYMLKTYIDSTKEGITESTEDLLIICVLQTANEEDMQLHLNRINNMGTNNDFKVNIVKMKYVVITKNTVERIEICTY